MDRKKLIIIAGAAIGLIFIIIVGILLFGRGGGEKIDCAKDPTNPACVVNCETDSTNPLCIVDCTKDPTNPACTVNCEENPNHESCKKQANIIMWGVFDEASYFSSAIKEFNKLYPNVKITYAKKQYSDYEKTMVDAIASEEGPDIFAIQNDWLPKHKAKISAISKDVLSTEDFNKKFVDAAYNDFVSDDRIYAIPLYFDNLALFYNRESFRANNIYNPPETWEEVIAATKILTKKAPGNPNEITQAGIALGTAGNITRANDILTALMLQTNTPIISQDKKSFNFHIFRKDENGEPYYPGTNALEFYTNFSKPTNAAYSWNDSFENNIVAFAKGRVAMIIGYQYFESLILRENPRMDFRIIPFPQIKIGGNERATLANYWAYTVSRNSKNKDLAWEFLNFLSKPDINSGYLQASGRISPFREDIKGSVFGEQKSIAKTIYKGNSDEYDRIFREMIDDVARHNQPLQSAIDTAAGKANEMLRRYQ